MSSSDLPRPFRPLALAWLGAALASALFASLVHFGLMVATVTPAAFSASLNLLPEFLLYAVAAAGVTMLVLVGIMAFRESGNTPRPLGAWLAVGLLATTPLALLGFGLANMGDPIEGAPAFEWRTLLVPAFFFACGLVGAATAFLIRHGSWRQ